MAKNVKMCDMPLCIAGKVFAMLNRDKVVFLHKETPTGHHIILTDVEPKDLIYPEGWYYAKGTFRNKHQSTTGMYEEAYMFKMDGADMWKDTAKYCTLDLT